ncbi:MAG: 2-succinyl-5-enolpyruvyl-6-hydroxy-3-cyclohexene-1-carboxylic-acid synthase [Ignavibacteriaceae bacterium]|jgi:2-succinyl-5-enolpyruvyl-6-hydroxy-3-cyclohexene-1-carboxylate synthase|nr:2-succinyl-5-enolpyruvyl-6-hydroxy-3-cyclohexene-1-carboxylic-acid synthase [Ignavibacteriaceae bacterium]
MKKINKNILWSTIFFEQLAKLGVKHVCISPGSRSTPLTLAAVYNKKLTCLKIIDERSSAFFASGIARTTGKPVVLICTSGTATAEYYPAIIEAYQQRIPLIVCTADRPPELVNKGANQMINQKNLYANHIRFFADAGLPETSRKKLESIKRIAVQSFEISALTNKGPVHINFPFEKPFEPESYTDNIPLNLELKYATREELNGNIKSVSKDSETLIKLIAKAERGLIIVGPDEYNKKFPRLINAVSNKTGFPIFADGASQLRFGTSSKKNVIANYDALLRSEYFLKDFHPDIILHFGRTITSKGLEQFLENNYAPKYLINEFGDWFDPTGSAKNSLAMKPFLFCQKLLEAESLIKLTTEKKRWLKFLTTANSTSEKIKSNIFAASVFPNEPKTINSLLKNLPLKANVMLSNSLPVRDFDFFASNLNKKITVFHNRGASGIDGILSTALGIAYCSKTPTVLLTGDLAFYYDLTSLLTAKQYNIPLIIILVNNNGGGIFQFLPIAKYENVFEQFFTMPHSLSFKNFVKEFGGNYSLIKKQIVFEKQMNKSLSAKNFSVLEIKTDAKTSLQLRKKYWEAVSNFYKNKKAAK